MRGLNLPSANSDPEPAWLVLSLARIRRGAFVFNK